MSEKRTIAPADKITRGRTVPGWKTHTDFRRKEVPGPYPDYPVLDPASIRWMARPLFRTRMTRYPADRKLQAVKAYLDHQGSLDTICTKYGIRTHEVLLQLDQDV